LAQRLGGLDVFVNNAGTRQYATAEDVDSGLAPRGGHRPGWGVRVYNAAKHGLGGLMKTASFELGQYGITANSVALGEIATPMTGQEDDDPHATQRPGVPLGRPGDAREIAAAIAFLASPQAPTSPGLLSWSTAA
jgi:NAD(P)-dependent dehydrogenase (short-subunit alcohol dehydrogenase family)